ncbi:hypothetical protein FRC03_000698 [Tulasnella sp. 419]|nr:hypothetical protein FRC02_004405 [Tulasnella sp. 418]KAG8965314.1 hypothetical protein FRC03_000698 [Tulasnella sp. 419]
MAFGFPQVNRDNYIEAESWQELKLGEAVTLIDSSMGKTFTPDATPMTGSTSRLMTLKNRCRDRVDVGIGFVHGDGATQTYEPTLYWEGVGSNTNVSIQFTPQLKIYLTKDYQATDILRGDIETPSLFTRDLNTLAGVTAWNVVETSGGSFNILPASKL